MASTLKSAEELSPLKRAYLALEKAQARIESLENSRREGIAVIGMGCRYPGGANCPEEYWELLASGRDAIVEVPPGRWDIDAFYDADPDAPGKVSSRYGGFIDNVDRFDAAFFGISPREAESLDPQQRLLLEVAHEAFEHAGLATERLLNSQTGVFVGLANGDYYCLVASTARSKIDAYLGTGTSPNAAAGRLSYVFGLRGPCLAVDTACSSSLVALHLACQSLRGGECDMALVGGVNVILAPELSITFSKAHMLCADGRCKTFDAAADGYVRGEGVGMVVLKRLSDAVAAEDRILAVIRGSAVNQDGPSSGLTVPNGPSQQDVIRRALAVADIQPEEIGYLETHGTGTALGDPIEMGAVGAVFGKRSEPLVVGSVKTNIGHLEGAAGIAGLMKVVLAMQHGQIPPHLHFKTPSPRIPWNDLPVRVPTEPTPWLRCGRRLAGVSSFGFSGINAHVVLEEAPPPAEESRPQRPCHLLPLSAKHPEALRQSAQRYASHLGADSDLSPSDVCLTAGAGRSHYEYRVAVVAQTASEAGQRLEAFVRGEPSAGLHCGSAKTEQPKVAFLFSGQGSQYAGMGKQLYETEPTFRAAFQQSAEILREYLEHPLEQVLYGEVARAALLDDTAYAQPSLFALEYALTQLWQSWGVRPAALLGHSLGECVAACVAGVFSLEDALKLVAARGRLMREPSPSGQTPLVETALEEFRRVAETVTYARPKLTLISNLSGKSAGEEIARPEYWCEQIRRPVRFSQGADQLFSDGLQTFLEIGPRSTLLGLARACWEAAAGKETPCWLSSLHPHGSDWQTLLDSLAELYAAGQTIDWDRFGRSFAGRRVALPTYPFQRRRYWIELGAAEAAAAADVSAPAAGFVHPLLGRRVHSAVAPDVVQFEGLLSAERPAYLAEHEIAGTPVLPASAYIEIGLAAARQVEPHKEMVLESVTLAQVMPLPRGQSRVVQVAVKPDQSAYRFELYGRPSADDGEEASPPWTLHATGRLAAVGVAVGVAAASGNLSAGEVDLDEVKRRCSEEVPLEGFYDRLRQHGMGYGPSFRGLKRLWRGRGEVLGEVELPEKTVHAAGGYLFYPPLLDACLHVTFDVAGPDAQRGQSTRATFVPVGVERLRLLSPAGPTLWSHARLREGPGPSEANRHLIDIGLFSPEGILVAELEGLRVQRVDTARLLPEVPGRPDRQEAEGGPPRDITGELRTLPASAQRQRIADFLEEELVKVFRSAGQEPTTRHKDLFELGMDSLMAVELLYRINRGLKTNLPMQKLLEYPAVAPLSEQLVRELDLAADGSETGDPAAAPATSAPVVGPGPVSENVRPADRRLEPGARIQLCCFHPPGGSTADYSHWPQVLRPEIEVCEVQLPESTGRKDEPPTEPWQSQVERLAERVLDYVDRPFALFGYGSGSLMAFDVAHFVQERFGLVPAHLFVAGAWAPEDVPANPSAGAVPARSASFPAAEAASDTGDAAGAGVHVAVDLRGFQLYRFVPRPPLDCPITAFFAEHDERFGREQLRRWRACTRGSFRLEMISGTFAAQIEAPEGLLSVIAQDLE